MKYVLILVALLSCKASDITITPTASEDIEVESVMEYDETCYVLTDNETVYTDQAMLDYQTHVRREGWKKCHHRYQADEEERWHRLARACTDATGVTVLPVRRRGIKTRGGWWLKRIATQGPDNE